MAERGAEAWGQLSIRPYQLMCLVCKVGSGLTADRWPPKLTAILRAARERPTVPATLRGNVDSAYRYQNPGREDDTSEGELFNAKRDLDILQQMGLVPGATRPLRELLARLLEKVPTALGICGYDSVRSQVWRGCADARSGAYERGRAKGIAALIPGRGKKEVARVKRVSAQVISEAAALRLRPHHLMCMTCFHGRMPEPAPILEDNLYEAIAAIHRNPDLPVELIAGCCMICPPCPEYHPETNLCVDPSGMGLRDQKKDLDLLQRLGLAFGDVLPAQRILKALYDEVHSAREICGYQDGAVRSPEWRICGRAATQDYQKGREAGLGVLG